MRIGGTDYLLVRTLHRTNFYLHLVNIYNESIHRLNVALPKDMNSKISVSQTFESETCAYIISFASRFFVGMIAREDNVTIGGFVAEGLNEFEMTSGQDISAVEIYPDKNTKRILLFLGTGEGSIEIWSTIDQRTQFLNSIHTVASISHLKYDPNPAERRMGSLFASHGCEMGQKYPLVTTYIILNDTIKADNKFKWNADYPDGKVTLFKVCRTENGHKIMLLFETVETSVKEANLLADTYYTAAAEISRSSTTIDDSGSVRDMTNLGLGNQSLVLYSTKIGKMAAASVVPVEENVSANLGSLPSFNYWFPRENFPYSEEKKRAVRDTRIRFGGELFFDKLLNLFGISKDLYPPDNVTQLEILCSAIFNCVGQTITLKHSLMYYLLKSCLNSSALEYASFYGVCRPYLLAMAGFWSFDNQYFSVIYFNKGGNFFVERSSGGLK